jgi:hypothetical protein
MYCQNLYDPADMLPGFEMGNSLGKLYTTKVPPITAKCNDECKAAKGTPINFSVATHKPSAQNAVKILVFTRKSLSLIRCRTPMYFNSYW